LLDILLEEVEWRRRALENGEGTMRLREEYERSLATLGRVVRVQTTTTCSWVKQSVSTTPED